GECSEKSSVGCSRFLDSLFLSRLRRPLGWFNPELFGIVFVQPLPAIELHYFGPSNTADRIPAEKAIQNIEADVPSGSAHCDKPAIETVPHRQARTASKGFEFPPRIRVAPAVLKHSRSVGSRHFYFGNL